MVVCTRRVFLHFVVAIGLLLTAHLTLRVAFWQAVTDLQKLMGELGMLEGESKRVSAPEADALVKWLKSGGSEVSTCWSTRSVARLLPVPTSELACARLCLRVCSSRRCWSAATTATTTGTT